MDRETCSRFAAIALGIFASLSSIAIADNGTVVSGTVIGIDPINQIMRVHVTGVNGQILVGSPQTSYVDYLVSSNTVVIGPSNQFVYLGNVLIGSQIHMQFVGAYASAIVLVGSGTISGFVTPVSAYPNNSYSQVQSYLPVSNYPSVVIRPRNQIYVSHNQQATNAQVGTTNGYSTTQHGLSTTFHKLQPQHGHSTTATARP